MVTGRLIKMNSVEKIPRTTDDHQKYHYDIIAHYCHSFE